MQVGVKTGAPFRYLDDFCPSVDWQELHDDISRGLAKVPWVKAPVSAGVHDDWKNHELLTYYKDAESLLSKRQFAFFSELKTMEERLKFLSLTTEARHPFWLCFLRVNKLVEGTYHENKADPSSCVNTPNMVFFPKLWSLIKKMPFTGIGRVLIFMTEANNETVPHFDAIDAEQRNRMGNADFIYFQPRRHAQGISKRIFVMDENKNRFYPDESKSFLWFNEMDWHGTEAAPAFTYSIRVEGVFNDLVRSAG